jgi:hypothetical protein
MSDLTDLQNELNHVVVTDRVAIGLVMSTGIWRGLCAEFTNTGSAGAPRDDANGRFIFGLPVTIDEDVTAIAIKAKKH